MSRRKFPAFSSLWQRHQELYVGIFVKALQRLSRDNGDTSHENVVSERLCPFLNDVCFEENQHNNCEIPNPCWEGPIQPMDKSELKGGKAKRPDFTCKRVNPYAQSAVENEISFHIECKLLGSPTSPRWILTENYVEHGITRFDCMSHEYGKRASSGMMLGYIVSMTPKEILKEVNSYQNKHCSHNPQIKCNSVQKGIQQYGQKLKRKNLKPKDFQLIHLWVDLRKSSTVPSKS